MKTDKIELQFSRNGVRMIFQRWDADGVYREAEQYNSNLIGLESLIKRLLKEFEHEFEREFKNGRISTQQVRYTRGKKN